MEESTTHLKTYKFNTPLETLPFKAQNENLLKNYMAFGGKIQRNKVKQ